MDQWVTEIPMILHQKMPQEIVYISSFFLVPMVEQGIKNINNKKN